MSKAIKLLVGLTISFLCIYLLYTKIDIIELKKVFLKVNFNYFYPCIIIQLIAQFINSLRYRSLFANTISIKDSFALCLISNASNQFLPLRGGEFIKVFLSKKISTLNYTAIVTRIFTERFLDVIFSLFLGIFSITFILYVKDFFINFLTFNINFSNLKTLKEILFLNLFFLTILLIFLSFIKFRVTILIFLLNKFSLIIKLKESFKEKIISELEIISKYIKWQNLNTAAYLSFICWTFVQSYAFVLVSKFLGLEINFVEALFLTFAAAMSFVIPSAPSAMGVFHAFIASSLVLLGFNLNQGVVFALVSHFFNVVFGGFYGLIAFLYFYYKHLITSK